MARAARRVHIAKGKSLVVLDPTDPDTTEDQLRGHMLGPTGNLRAPTLRIGKELMVGFHEATYQSLLAR